jgi:uncharacterized membrane protein YfcA
MLTSPIFAMIDSSFVPAALMVAVVPLTIGVAVRDRQYIDTAGFTWALTGRFPGVFIGIVALNFMDGELLAYAVALAVLVAVSISVITSRRGQIVDLTPRTMSGAGFASGFMGTVTSIGGPPMALVYKDGDPRVMRATLAGFFSIGALISVAALGIAGKIGRHELALTAVILPGVLAGLPASKVLGKYLPERRMRPLILAICGLSATALILQTALF